MAVIRDGQAPYATSAAVLSVIEGFRTKHPQTPFTSSNIQLLGVSGSLAPRTMQALQLLDLVDGAGEPTGSMVALREASTADFPERLAEVVTAAYSEVFAYKDPRTDAPAALEEVFRFYKPPSMQPRMLRLFYGLCQAAGLIDEVPAVENKPSTTNGAPRRTATVERSTRAKGGKAGQSPPVSPPPPPPPASKDLPEIVAALVAKLPKKGETWTAEDAAWWLQMAGMAFPREYNYAPVAKGES